MQIGDVAVDAKERFGHDQRRLGASRLRRKLQMRIHVPDQVRRSDGVDEGCVVEAIGPTRIRDARERADRAERRMISRAEKQGALATRESGEIVFKLAMFFKRAG